MQESIEPWLSKDVLGLLGYKTCQLYPLDEHPYGYRMPRTPRDPKSYWQVKARPGDPLSPFIWGHTALMMVMGGYYDPRSAPNRYPGNRKPYRVRTGEDVYQEPEPGFSDAHTTNALLAAMLNAGFTWDEAVETFERHEHAGGAYWAWVHRFTDEEKTQKMIQEWRGSKRDESLTPISITTSMNPWRNNFLLNRYTQGLSIKEKVLYTPHEGFTVEIKSEVVEKLLRLIGNPSITGYESATGVQVATLPYLKKHGPVKHDGMLRDGYIPWMIKQGLIIEHDQILGGKGRKPRGFSLPDALPAPTSVEPVSLDHLLEVLSV